LIKLAAITALGVPAIAVLIFEITLNGLALFNHANIRLPSAIEKPLRLILITQALHRIHHSQSPEETNSNFGFSVTWWDRLFGSYKSQASQPDKRIALGLSQYPNPEQNSSLWQLLIMPFKK
jgi:sterol desaturase/sphingolipid hydroxylase (fatty acid hydroxylase superfamily)